MNTGNLLWPPAWPPISLPSGWASRWLRTARGWYGQRRRPSHAGSAHLPECLFELDARTLRDIGAPPALQARALRRHQAQRDRLDDLRAGGAAGDWQRW